MLRTPREATFQGSHTKTDREQIDILKIFKLLHERFWMIRTESSWSWKSCWSRKIKTRFSDQKTKVSREEKRKRDFLSNKFSSRSKERPKRSEKKLFKKEQKKTLRTPIQQHEGSKGNRKDDVKAAGRIRKKGGSSPMANFKDPIHHRRAWACWRERTTSKAAGHNL